MMIEIIIGIFAGYCCAYFLCDKFVNMTPAQVIKEYLQLIYERLYKLKMKLEGK